MLYLVCVVITCWYLFSFVFFFKQKTAYEMRISDWSSDVCSSDLLYGLSGAASGLADNRGALLRAAALVRVLESQSVAPARLSAGLLPSFPGKVRLHFTVAVAPAPGGENQP